MESKNSICWLFNNIHNVTGKVRRWAECLRPSLWTWVQSLAVALEGRVWLLQAVLQPGAYTNMLTLKKTTTTKNFDFYCCSMGRWWQTCLFLVLAVDWPTSFQTNALSLSCISSPSVFILNKVSLTSLAGLILVTVHLSLQSSWGNEPEPPGLDEIKHF